MNDDDEKNRQEWINERSAILEVEIGCSREHADWLAGQFWKAWNAQTIDLPKGAPK